MVLWLTMLRSCLVGVLTSSSSTPVSEVRTERNQRDASLHVRRINTLSNCQNDQEPAAGRAARVAAACATTSAGWQVDMP